VIDADSFQAVGFMPFYPDRGSAGIVFRSIHSIYRGKHANMTSPRDSSSCGRNQYLDAVSRGRCDCLGIEQTERRALNGSKLLIWACLQERRGRFARIADAEDHAAVAGARGALDYNDPYFPQLGIACGTTNYEGMKSVPLSPQALHSYDGG